MKIKIILLILLLLNLSISLAQVTNTNALWTTNTTMNVIRTNIPFRLSQYPQLSGVSNILASGNVTAPGFYPTTNTWPNAGSVDLSTNNSYGYRITSSDITISGFVYGGSFATNDACSSIWFTNQGAATHTVTTPASC